MTKMMKVKITPRLAGFYFFYYATIGAFIPYWSLYLETNGFNKFQIGVLLAITMCSRIVAPVLWGWLADRAGRRMPLIRLATVAEMLAWLAIFIVPKHFIAFMIIMVLFSFFQNAIVPQFEAVTLSWLSGARQKYGQLRLWGSIGFIVTVFGLGALFDWFSIAYLPIMLAILSIACFVIAMLIPEPPFDDALEGSSDSSKTSHQDHHATTSFFYRLKTPKIAWFFIGQFILLLSHAPFYSFYSNYLAEYDYSITTIGLLWSMGVVAEIVLFIKSPWILARFHPKHLVTACFIATTMRWGLVGGFPEYLGLQFLAQCCHAFSFGLFQVCAMQFMTTTFSANQQGRAQALYSSLWGLGVALGTLIAGRFWEFTGGAFWFMASALVTALFAAVWLFFAKKTWHQVDFKTNNGQI